MVKAVRDELGIIQPEKRKGKDGKHYPAKMKREKRTDDEESDRDKCPYDARRVNLR